MLKIAIASGKGGTGKTFVSTNLFSTLEQAGYTATLVDCDAEVPNASLFIQDNLQQETTTSIFCPQADTTLCTYCGTCAEVCHFHAITCIPSVRYLKIMPDLCHGCTACLHLCPAQAIRSGWKAIGKISFYGKERTRLIEARLNEGEHSSVRILQDAISSGEQTASDFLILDAPPGCSCPFVHTAAGADLVLLVTEPTPFGLSDLKHTITVLREMNKPFGVIINRSDIGDGQLQEFLRTEQIPLWTEIPYSETIASLYAQGKLAVREDLTARNIFLNLLKHIVAYEISCNQRKGR